MSDQQPNPISGSASTEAPPAAEQSAAESDVSWWKKKWWKLPVWAWIAIGLFLVGGLSGVFDENADEAATTATTQAEPGTEAPAPAETGVPVTPAPSLAPPTAATTAAPATTEPPVTTAGFTMQTWFVDHAEEFTTTATEISNFAEAANNFDIAEVERSGRVVSANMEIMAKSLEGETDPAAVATRNAFNSCSVAYGTAADAASDADAEGLSAATDLIDACTKSIEDATDAING